MEEEDNVKSKKKNENLNIFLPWQSERLAYVQRGFRCRNKWQLHACISKDLFFYWNCMGRFFLGFTMWVI